MKTNIIAFKGIGLLVLFALGFVSVFEIRLASAQVDATKRPDQQDGARQAPGGLLTLGDANPTAASPPFS